MGRKLIIPEISAIESDSDLYKPDGATASDTSHNGVCWNVNNSHRNLGRLPPRVGLSEKKV